MASCVIHASLSSRIERPGRVPGLKQLQLGPQRCTRRHKAFAVQASEDDTAKLKDGIRCYMTADGALVCEKLAPGNYKLEAAAPRTHDESGALKDAPVCDPTRPQDCLTYCYVLENGAMVCEGLPSGEYEIKSAGPEDLEKMVLHAMALQNGATSKDIAESAVTEKPNAEGGVLAKITGFFRGS